MLEPAGGDPRGHVIATDAGILAAVAAEQPAMVALLGELVAAPTLLGHEAAGQAVMRRAFAGLGLAPFDVPLDRRRWPRIPGRSPFSWDVDGKANVARGLGRRRRRRPLADPQRAHRRRQPRAAALWSGDPFAPASRASGCTAAARAT